MVVHAAAIPAGKKESRFTITAPADAKKALVLPKVTGTAKIGGKDVTHPAAPAEEIQQAFSYMHRVPTEELLLSVVAPGPFTMTTDLADGKVLEIPQGGEAKVVVKITRRKMPPPPAPPKPAKPAKGKPAPKAKPKAAKNTQAPIKIAADAPTKGITVRAATIAPGKNEATISIRVQKNFAAGFQENIILTGSMKVGKDTLTAYAPAVPIKVVVPAKPKPKPKPPAKKPSAKPKAATKKSPTKPKAATPKKPTKPAPKAPEKKASK